MNTDKLMQRSPRRNAFSNHTTLLSAGMGIILSATACDTTADIDHLVDPAAGTISIGAGVSLRIDLDALDAQGAGDTLDADHTALRASVEEDVRQLVPDLSHLATRHQGTSRDATIVVRFAGRAALGEKGATQPHPDLSAGPRVAEDPDSFSFLAFNPASRNQFEVAFPRALLSSMHEDAVASGLNAEVRLDETADPPRPIFANSGGVDNRMRFYGVNAPVTHWERQRVSDFGGCSATLIGPRHVITAAHCVYNRAAGAGMDPWTDDVSVRVARNGTSNLGTVLIDNDNIPAGQVLWYWVPSSYISASAGSDVSEFDISVVVTPGRIGETTGGWMGWWVLNQSTMNTQSLWNVGYPACNATLADGTPRTDEPNPCSENHLYGDVGTCFPDDFTNSDNDGWNRNFRHRCDASAGQSGSPIYVNYNSSGWGVTAVHIASLCGTTAGSSCSSSLITRPLRATRITPEYSGVISYFRNLYQ